MMVIMLVKISDNNKNGRNNTGIARMTIIIITVITKTVIKWRKLQ